MVMSSWLWRLGCLCGLPSRRLLWEKQMKPWNDSAPAESKGRRGYCRDRWRWFLACGFHYLARSQQQAQELKAAVLEALREEKMKGAQTVQPRSLTPRQAAVNKPLHV